MVVVSALAAGPGAVLTGARSAAAAATAAGAGKPVWAVVTRGVLLPALVGAIVGPRRPRHWHWHRHWHRHGTGTGTAPEVVDAALLGGVVGDAGLEAAPVGLSRHSCPAAAELLGWKS